MTSHWQQYKDAVASTAKRMAELGLVSGTSGNVSVRLPPLDGTTELMAVTPSGRRYDDMTGDDIVVMDYEMEPLEGELPPSSESLLHVAIYRARPDVQAVVHTHSVFTSVLAVAGLDIPPITDEVMVAVGGTVRVSDYAFPGTQELADSVTAALGDRGAALIRNHGAVGVGRTLKEALDICVLMERVAQVFIYASALGRVNLLPPEAVQREVAIYRMRHGLDATL